MFSPASNTRHPQDRNSHDIRLQDVFLNFCRREKIAVSLFCVDQNIRHGRIIGFDLHSIILESQGRQHLVYKSGITAIEPQSDFAYIFKDGNRQDPYRQIQANLPENYDYTDIMA